MSTHKDIPAFTLGGLLLLSLALAGCGGSAATTVTPPSTLAAVATSSTDSSTQVAGSGTSAPTTPPASGGTDALTAEAGSAAAGDIPDNQVFLTFHDAASPFSLQYPEGWAQSGSGDDVTFKDKSNIARVAVTSGALPTVGDVQAQMVALAGRTPSLKAGEPQAVTVSGSPAVKVTYTTRSAPSPVTGKSLTLSVDRYYLAGKGGLAIVDLGTPVGVDNVDAFRQMIESFRWR